LPWKALVNFTVLNKYITLRKNNIVGDNKEHSTKVNRPSETFLLDWLVLLLCWHQAKSACWEKFWEDFFSDKRWKDPWVIFQHQKDRQTTHTHTHSL